MESTFLITAIIILLASFVHGFSGFGFALVSIPLLSIFVDIKYAIPLGALCGFVVNIYLAFELKEHIKYFELKNLLIGAFLGVPIGVFGLDNFDTGILRLILGIFVLTFVLLNLTQIIKQKQLNTKWGYLIGLLSGIFGGAFNTNGPPVLIYFFIQGWDKLKFKSMITGFFIISSFFIVGAHAISGVTTEKVFFDFLYLLPAVFAGILIGSKLFKKVSTELFNKIVLFALILISLLLIFK